MFSLNCIPQILYAETLDKRLIIRVKSFPLRHNTSVTAIQTTIVP